VTERALALDQSLRARGAEPVFTLGHLAHLTGAPPRYLRDIIGRRRDPYLDIDRPKHDGRTRPISSPEPVLMDVHRWLLHNVLAARDAHRCSWAYQPGRSIVGAARMHLGARWLVKLDLHDFFGSIHEPTVFSIFRGLGYPRLLSFELARLCTRPSLRARGIRQGQAPYLGMPAGTLPQGAPTSGALANAAMVAVDERLADLAAQRRLVYTRYSDDLTFSAGDSFSRREAARVVNEVTAVLGRQDLIVHHRKTAVVPPGARKVVLGLLLLDDRIGLQPEFKRRVQVHIRGVRIFGLVEHAKHRRFASVLSMIDHVDGCIAFARSVDPSFADSMRGEWDAVLHDNGIPAV
jgi:RNA-directed DNA polymerase